jgi:hypothetical protein
VYGSEPEKHAVAQRATAVADLIGQGVSSRPHTQRQTTTVSVSGAAVVGAAPYLEVL